MGLGLGMYLLPAPMEVQYHSDTEGLGPLGTYYKRSCKCNEPYPITVHRELYRCTMYFLTIALKLNYVTFQDLFISVGTVST